MLFPNLASNSSTTRVSLSQWTILHTYITEPTHLTFNSIQ
uniref:Uncharacterized protein n=1 Tax=Rhizophora mucronata TaxID=61149 RepID=A0A2P2QRE7_RHIMU